MWRVSFHGRLDTIWYFIWLLGNKNNNIHAKKDFLHLAKEEMMTGDKGSGGPIYDGGNEIRTGVTI